jgi:hypothetical protein
MVGVEVDVNEGVGEAVGWGVSVGEGVDVGAARNGIWLQALNNSSANKAKDRNGFMVDPPCCNVVPSYPLFTQAQPTNVIRLLFGHGPSHAFRHVPEDLCL